MLEKIPSYVAVLDLVEGIKNYQANQNNLTKLIDQISTVSETYYEGHGAIAATNSEMKMILNKMRFCYGTVKHLYDSLSTERSNFTNGELEKMKKAYWRLNNAIEEIDRWTTEEGHWKE